MEKELLLEIKKSIEEMERTVDWEWGDCRELEELISQKLMPDLYYKILKILNK